jgi:hypothetical protein
MTMALDPETLTDDERALLRAIRDVATEIGQTADRARKNVMAKYGLSEHDAQLAITFGIELSKSFSAKLAGGGSFDDCENLDEQILKAIREIIDRANQ